MDWIQQIQPRSSLRRTALLMLLTLLGIAPVFGQRSTDATPDTSSLAVPASRQADRVVIITLRGEIDRWSELSVKRRIAQAEESGADAIVLEVDSPGGEVGAVLEICNALKGSSISNTVAWVNPDAYSGGAIAALACGEIVTSDPASMGDAFPITFGPQGVRGLSPDERTKFLPPLLTEVADSARRNGYDEFLVQAMVIDGIELWRIRDSETGVLWFINENEYRTLFDSDPPRGKPLLTSVTNGRASQNAGPVTKRDTDDSGVAGNEEKDEQTPPRSDADSNTPAESEWAGDEPESTPNPSESTDKGDDDATLFTPASPTLADLTESTSAGLTRISERPVFSEADRGRYVDPAYVCDGSGPIVLRDDQLRAFGFTSAIINNDTELKAFFAAKEIVRVERSWSENMVKAMMNPILRGVLIVLILVGLFLEMSSPGMIVPGAVAGLALAGLIAPPMLVGMAGWWEIVAIGAGIACLLIELLVIPGFGIFGILGLVGLFVGMVGTFIPDGTGGLFGPADTGDELFGGVATVLLSTATAGVLIFFIAKHFGAIPVLGRLVLDTTPSDDDNPNADLLSMASSAQPPAVPGDRGVATSDLRPSGKVKVNEHLLDAISERGYIEDGQPVEIVTQRGFSWVVRPATPQSENSNLPRENLTE